jgi:hypothetical protein
VFLSTRQKQFALSVCSVLRFDDGKTHGFIGQGNVQLPWGSGDPDFMAPASES